MLSTASKYPKKNLDCSLTLQNLSQKERLGFESDVYHFDTCPRLLGLNWLPLKLRTYFNAAYVFETCSTSYQYLSKHAVQYNEVNE